jgi:hypothetical protein
MRPRREGTTLPRQRCPVQACNCLVALPATESLAEYPPCYIFELGPSKRIFRDSNPDLRCVTITLNTRGSIANRHQQMPGVPRVRLATHHHARRHRSHHCPAIPCSSSTPQTPAPSDNRVNPTATGERKHPGAHLVLKDRSLLSSGNEELKM